MSKIIKNNEIAGGKPMRNVLEKFEIESFEIFRIDQHIFDFLKGSGSGKSSHLII